MKGVFVWGGVVAAIVAGCSSAGPTREPTRQSSAPIQGGSDDTTHDFAVAVALDLGNGEGAICSGALLAPNLVATARHCTAMLSSRVVDCSSSTFGASYAASQFIVTSSPVLEQGAAIYSVSKIVVPTGAGQNGVCGNDIALLILAQNVSIPQYVQPVIDPPMNDPGWANELTAIGYGIDSPLDDAGISAGTRRIKENVPIVCIPSDSATGCETDRENVGVLSEGEFRAGDGVCEGDSGSSAFDQTQFNGGKWVSFGTLSRSPTMPGATTCVGSVYTRFDAWGQLLVETAMEAAQMGGYTPPAWASAPPGTPSSDGGAPPASPLGSGVATGADGASCGANDDCLSQNCVSKDGGKTFVCASECGDSSPCASGTSCVDGYCFADPASGGKKSGCSVGGPVGEAPWRAAAWFVAPLGLILMGRRHRRRR